MNLDNKIVGIVIVSYNASEAVSATLDSIARMSTGISFAVALVDNGSALAEREKIAAAFKRSAAEQSNWSFIQLEKNLVFSVGNNFVILQFLENDSISHVCLLNSDTVVTDYWLDRLLVDDVDMISPVTNRADSDQCIPTDYEFELEASLHADGTLKEDVLKRVNQFAQRRFAFFRGRRLESEPTFFCVLLSRHILETVGLLDENFFPGAYEDDDYCRRAKDCGFRLFLARDVFVHHWGDVSFGKLDWSYFYTHAENNRRFFEQKHQIAWEPRAQKAFSSYRDDVLAMLGTSSSHEEARFFENLFRSQLAPRIPTCIFEYKKLRADAKGRSPVEKLLDQAGDPRSLAKMWKTLLKNIDEAFSSKVPSTDGIALVEDAFLRLEAAILALAKASMACNTSPESSIAPPQGRFANLKRRGALLKRVFKLFLHRDGIIFFGGYFFPEREKDGYFQRIATIDRLFPEQFKVYIDMLPCPQHFALSWLLQIDESTAVLSCHGSRRRNYFVQFCVFFLALRYRKIYCHSVLSLFWGNFAWLFRIPGLASVMDIHGVVPEEYRYHNNFFDAVRTEKLEELAVGKARQIIVVSNVMGDYLQKKYQTRAEDAFVVYPVLPDIPETVWAQEESDRPVVVYGGGLHKWQMPELMASAMIARRDDCLFEIYTPNPDEFAKFLPEQFRDYGSFILGGKSHEELMRRYPHCHYGFILREDNVVNHVACPTKLVEYLAMGIVPVVNSPAIGDFKDLRMRYVTLEDFMQGNLPCEAERRIMAEHNRLVYHAIRDISAGGIKKLRSSFI